MANNATNIYDYLISPQFAQQITSILENHVQMTSELESEKRLLMKNWRKREVGLGHVIDSVVNVIGTIQSMVGNGKLSIPMVDEEVDLIDEQSSAN
jgi:hypothetical protein